MYPKPHILLFLHTISGPDYYAPPWYYTRNSVEPLNHCEEPRNMRTVCIQCPCINGYYIQGESGRSFKSSVLVRPLYQPSYFCRRGQRLLLGRGTNRYQPLHWWNYSISTIVSVELLDINHCTGETTRYQPLYRWNHSISTIVSVQLLNINHCIGGTTQESTIVPVELLNNQPLYRC